MHYHDFDLLIDRSGDSLRAQVLNSPAGQASAEFCLPFSEDKLENYLLRLGRTHGVATRRVESQEMNTAKAFGAALFDAVFTGDVKAVSTKSAARTPDCVSACASPIPAWPIFPGSSSTTDRSTASSRCRYTRRS